MTKEEQSIIDCARRLSALWDAEIAAHVPGKDKAADSTSPPYAWLTEARKELKEAVHAASIEARDLRAGDWVVYMGRAREVRHAYLGESGRMIVTFTRAINNDESTYSIRAAYRLAKGAQ